MYKEHTCVFLYVLAHGVNCSLLQARVQKFESQSVRILICLDPQSLVYIAGTQRLFDEWKAGFQFSQQSSRQYHPPQPRNSPKPRLANLDWPNLSAV